MRRAAFVLLEHDQRAAADPSGPVLHWDLMVEQPDGGLLATWRLHGNPLRGRFPLRAERIADHRRAYLLHEGPVSGGRGLVRRLAQGTAELAEGPLGADAVLCLRGERLSGRFAVRSGWLIRQDNQAPG